MFPEERLSCVVGREVKFLLAVDKGGAAGCCIMASSTEPMRTEIFFAHALKDELDVMKILLGSVLSFLSSRRAPDVEAKYVENMHSPELREILNYHRFTEVQKVRMLLRTKEMNKISQPIVNRLRVRSTDSLLIWRSVLVAATTGQSIEQSRKQVNSETPSGTIQEDELARLIGYTGNLPVGTIGYSTCMTIGYLDKLSTQTNLPNRTAMMEKLLEYAIARLVKKRCEYAIIDVPRDDMSIDTLTKIGFRPVGKVSHFSKTVTPR
jgi:hypothetical protein